MPLIIGFSIVRWPSKLHIISKSNATPPPHVFSIMWTLFYFLLGILLYRLILPFINGEYITSWRIGTLVILVLHLILTFGWPLLYAYGYRRQALYDIVLVLASVLVLQMMLINHDQLFVVLLAPYIAWLIFALHLNYEAVTSHVTN